ncbi:MAG: hypothetical protein ABEI31_07715 [Halodesulfurarchaeum sp.]
MTEENATADRDERVTSPMQAFGTREVGIGVSVLAVGLLVTFVLPFVF